MEGAGLGDLAGLEKQPRVSGILQPNEKIMGSCDVEKFNDSNKLQPRILLITNLAVYNIQRNENFIKSMMSKLLSFQNKFTVRRRIPLETIDAITMSNQNKNNEFVLHVAHQHDYRFKIHNYDLKIQLLKCICLHYERLTKKKVPFYFKNDITLTDYVTSKVNLKAKQNRKPKEAPTFLDMQDLVDYELPGVVFKPIHWRGDKPLPIAAFKSSSIEAIKPGREYFAIDAKPIKFEQIQQRLHNPSPFIFLPSFCFETSDKIYMLWPLSIGGRLHKVIQKVGHLKQDLCIFYVAQLILAIEALHKKGWIYRNLTLKDIFIKQNGYIWLHGLSDSMRKNREGELLYDMYGSCPNMPPEMILMEGHSSAVDIWALAVCTFMMIQGQHPFEGGNTKIIFQKILSGTLVANEPLPAFVHKASVANPKERISLQEIKKDEWFSGMDWDKLQRQELIAPYLPEMDSVHFWDGKFPSVLCIDL